jgi:lipopolysaccharide biosynthesis regulator YciM
MGGKRTPLGRLKRLAGLTAPETPPYRCHGCETGFEVQYHVCPDCGSYTVERAERGA